MLIAGTVNLCILLLAAANLAGVPGTDSLEGAYAALRDENYRRADQAPTARGQAFSRRP